MWLLLQLVLRGMVSIGRGYHDCLARNTQVLQAA